MRHGVRKEERRKEDGQHRKKGWRENVSRKEQRTLDEKVTAVIEEMEQDLKMQKRISVMIKEFVMLN